MKIFTKKRVIWIVVILLLAGAGAYFVFGKKNSGVNIQTDTVKKLNLIQTVLATGQVVSGTDLSLSFQTSGTIKSIRVKEGDQVRAGQVLAALDQANLLAGLTSARGALAQAQANYDKVLAGASNEQIKVQEKAVAAAQVTLDNARAALVNARAEQETAVDNAYSTLLNTSIAAIAQPGNTGATAPAISGAYTGKEEGMYKIIINNTSSGMKFLASGLEFFMGGVGAAPTPLGTHGLYIQFLSTPSLSDSWIVYIPNTYSSSYITNYNAYQAALKAKDTAIIKDQATINSSRVELDQAQASLDQLRAKARPADINAAQAAILSAQGQMAAAQAAIANASLIAPASGTITSVDIKLGEVAVPQKQALALQDVNNLHLEADISEANIASVTPAQSIDVTFDALGPERHFKASAQTINPASTIISGVVNFKITASISKVAEIKPGMTANLVILTAKKDNVLAVPSRAVINQEGKQYVRLIDDPLEKSYHQVKAQTGLQADGGLTEIISGLEEGQEIVVFIKQ